MIVANLNLNLMSCSILITTLVLSGCNAQKLNINSEINNEESMIVNSECQSKTVFDDSIPARVSYFDYMGKMVKFEPDSSSYSESQILTCLDTNQGLIIVGQNRTHPSESLAQMTLSTYLYRDNKFISKKYLNQAWSCIPDHSMGKLFNTSDLTINIKCKDKKKGNGNIGSPFDQQFSVDIL